jgi:hypothetical protein
MGREVPTPARRAVDAPRVSVGSPKEYAYWKSRLAEFVTERGGEAGDLEQVDARMNYRENRVILYQLPDPRNELSIAETLSHETLHALLYQMGELWAARLIDFVGKPVGNPRRVGGI